MKTSILPSIDEPCTKIIKFQYNDNETGPVIESLTLNFIKKAKPSVPIKENLIDIKAHPNYIIEYDPIVVKLIQEINNLSFQSYKEVIACSLRAILDISIDVVSKNNKFHNFFKGITKFEDKVIKVVNYFAEDKHNLSALVIASKIDYNTFKNVLSEQAFRVAVGHAHIGAHKSTSYESDLDIKDLAHKVSFFVILINEMCTNDKLTS